MTSPKKMQKPKPQGKAYLEFFRFMTRLNVKIPDTHARDFFKSKYEIKLRRKISNNCAGNN